MILWNKSRRTASVVLRATREAMRLAIIFPSTAIMEKMAISTPQNAIRPMFRMGITSSTMWARHQGSSRSMMVPVNLMVMPPHICPKYGRR